MRITNKYHEKISVLAFNPGDHAWSFLVDIYDPGNALTWNLPIPRDRWVVSREQTAELWGEGGPCHLGVKPESVPGIGPYLGTPSRVVYPTYADLEVTASGEIVWLNEPMAPDPTPRLTDDELRAPLPETKGLVVGVGKAEVTDAAAYQEQSALAMQGWAEPEQLTKRVETPLFARAFVIADGATGKRVVFVVADIWSCSIALKDAVVGRLNGDRDGIPYDSSNVHIAGTHTHSGPGGFTHHLMYNVMAGGFDPHVFESMVRGIVTAIERAHTDLAPGFVLLNEGGLSDVAFNRSMTAFDLNHADVRWQFPRGVDEGMTLLRFAHGEPNSGDELGIGALCWFGIHATNRGKGCTAVNGDNKGWAAHRFEEMAAQLSSRTREGFVAGFANAAAGDVSGNVDNRTHEFAPVHSEGSDASNQQRMHRVGQAQADFAFELYESAALELSGPVEVRHQRINLAERAKARGALGLSMGAGSPEDGGPGLLPEGLHRTDPDDFTAIGGADDGISVVAVLAALIDPLINLAGSRLHAGAAPDPSSPAAWLVRTITGETWVDDSAHYPKPILVRSGSTEPVPLTPNIVPIQMFRVGQFAVLGVPGEPTTGAGWRMREAVADVLGPVGVERLVVAGYANGYASYITTFEEYQAQQYEGASTLHGPRTCEAYTNAFADMARALRRGRIVVDDVPQPDLSEHVLTKARLTFRNHTTDDVRFRIYAPNEGGYRETLWSGGDVIIAAAHYNSEGQLVPSDRAVVLPWTLGWLPQLQVVLGHEPPSEVPRLRLHAVYPSPGDLVSVLPDGTITTGTYDPQAR